MGTLVFVFGIGALLVLAMVGLLIWYVRHSAKASRLGSTLAAAMGWQLLPSTTPAKSGWYGAMVGDRRAALRSVFVLLPTVSAANVNGCWVIRLVLAPHVRRPFGVDLSYRHEVEREAPFEQRFEGEGAGTLPSEVRSALEQFIAACGPSSSSRPRRRGEHPIHLRVADRPRVGGMILPADLLADAPLLLIHEQTDMQLTPAGVQQILQALSQVAYAFERWDAGDVSTPRA